VTDQVSLVFTQDFTLSCQITENTVGPISDFIQWSVNWALAKKITPFISENMDKSKVTSTLAAQQLCRIYLHMA